MKSSSKLPGILFAAAVLTTSALQAEDKPAAPAPATNSPPLAASSAKLNDLFPDVVIAKGKGWEIKQSRLDEAMAGVRATAIARGRQITAADIPEIERSSFNHLLHVQLLLSQATDADKAKGKAEAEKRLDLIKQRATSQEKLDQQLKAMNLNMDDLRNRLYEEAAGEQVLRDKVTVTDDQVKKYYEDNPSQFEEAETVHGNHILLLTTDKTGAQMPDDDKKAKKKMADDLLKRARGGEDFSKLAKDFSDDPTAKDNGGEFTLPKGRMPKEFEAAVFTLQTNQISDVVTSQLGYHIIKLLDKNPAKKLEFEKVSADLRTYLESLEMEKILPDFAAKLKKDADVQILDPKLKSLIDAGDDQSTPPAGAKGLTMPK